MAASTCLLLQAGMRWLESAYPENARGWVGFNVPMSHKVFVSTPMHLPPMDKYHLIL